MRAWLLLVLLACAGVAAAQEVELGGRLDLEFIAGDDARFDFGRLAGVDLTFRQPGQIDAYFDYSVAGGRGRVQELYARLPQTERYVTVTLGRFLLPYGDAGLVAADRYALGARDLFDTYRGYRRGNVLLDTDVTGVGLSRALGPVALDLVGAVTADTDDLSFTARLTGAQGGWRAGASAFTGRDRAGTAMTQAAVHLGYAGAGFSGLGHLFLGHATGDDHRGWQWRLGYRWPTARFDLFAAQTGYADDLVAASTLRFGAGYRFGGAYRVEAGFDANNGQDDQFVLGLLGVF